MTHAFMIETADIAAGIVVLERGGMRFHAAEPAFFPLDGKAFKSLRDARRAVDDLRNQTLRQQSPQKSPQKSQAGRPALAGRI